MENTKGMWSEEEVKTLFKFVEIKKSEGVALIKIFEQYADKVGRMPNSVRNYYYKEVSTLLKDNNRCKSLGINIANHKVLNVEAFTKKDETRLKSQVDKLIEQGNSVRKSCLILADGDATKMIRIQNKYRTLKKKESKEMTNVIKMPIKRNILNDEDVNALFLGLVKLVKKQEFEKAKVIYENDLASANEKLKEAIASMLNKENKIDELKKQINVLQCQSKVLKRKIEKMRTLSAKKSASSMLKDYFKSENNSGVELKLN